MHKVAVLGLGIMGQGLAANLLKAGFPLTVYNRTRSKAEPLSAQGAQIADSPRQAAEGADVIIGMVGDDNSSRAIWLNEDGALANAKGNTVLIECSTLSPEWVRELHGIVVERGCRFIDSPVAGSKDAAASGTLKLFVGGDAQTIADVRPVLDAISSEVVHLGPVSAGAAWKLINNMMAAVQVAVLAEGIVLAERAGLDMTQVVDLIKTGATASPSVKGKVDRIFNHDYNDTHFALRWMHKDVTYALELAHDFNLPLPTVEAALRVYQSALDKGLADNDFSAVVEGVR
jgi:3-hydroxyisobutyrate dehydrogenase